jgi:L-alanine-DL-glutamate epimerase-like enolase superfamily enzyme
MQLSWDLLTLDLRVTFRTAHGASDQRRNVIVHLDEGLGEAAGVPYLGESAEGIGTYLASAADALGDGPLLFEETEEIIARLPAGSPAARAGLDIALHDLLGRRLGQPLWRILGLDPGRAPLTSFTIALDTPEAMARRAAATRMPILKIKLGGPDDEQVLAAVRGASPARLRVDANAGWTRAQAAERIARLARLDLELVEQPLAVGDIEGLRWLRDQQLGVPIFADESIRTAQDVAAHAGAVDGVVIKLAKSGGICEAVRAIATARDLGLQVMIGCMIESSVGVTAAAHLAPLCDLADLDGPLLVSNDPYVGVAYEGARLVLPEAPGLGVKPRKVLG